MIFVSFHETQFLYSFNLDNYSTLQTTEKVNNLEFQQQCLLLQSVRHVLGVAKLCLAPKPTSSLFTHVTNNAEVNDCLLTIELLSLPKKSRMQII